MPEPGSPPTLKCFFDRVVRRSFGDLALRDDPAADYLSDLLARFAHTENLYPTSGVSAHRLESVAEALLEIQRVWDVDSPHFNPLRERELRRHIGDLPFFRRLITAW